MADQGKTSTRRPGEGYAEGYTRIFGDKPVKPGRTCYRWVSGQGFVEIPPPKPLSSDLRFEGTFQSPVTGEVISTKQRLDRHNKENSVEQVLPGMRQDQSAHRADMHDKAFGKQAKQERLKDVIRAVEKGEQNA